MATTEQDAELICTFLHKPDAAYTTTTLITKQELITCANYPALGQIPRLVKGGQGLSTWVLPLSVAEAKLGCLDHWDQLSPPLT